MLELARVSWQPLTAAANALAVEALYAAILSSEGEGELTQGRTMLVSACLIGAAVGLCGGLVAGPKARAALYSAAAAFLAAWAVLGSFSIGLLLVPAAVLAWISASEALRVAGREGAFGAAGAIAVVAVGLLVT